MRVYLASPYSSHDEKLLEWRVKMAEMVTAKLMLCGFNVFSPIVHSDAVEKWFCGKGSHDFWLEKDFSYIDYWAEILFVLKLEGWKESAGVGMEIERANMVGIDIRKYTWYGILGGTYEELEYFDLCKKL